MKFTPLAEIFTTASFAFGSGRGTSASCRTSGPPVVSTRIAFMRTAYTPQRAAKTLASRRDGDRRRRALLRHPAPAAAGAADAARLVLLRRFRRRAVLSGLGTALSAAAEAHRRRGRPLRHPRRRHLLAPVHRRALRRGSAPLQRAARAGGLHAGRQRVDRLLGAR